MQMYTLLFYLPTDAGWPILLLLSVHIWRRKTKGRLQLHRPVLYEQESINGGDGARDDGSLGFTECFEKLYWPQNS